MNFIMTKYIYPLKERVCISKKLGLYLDNPRSRKEIDVLSKLLRNSNENSKHNAWPPYNKTINTDDCITIENVIREFSKKNNTDNYVKTFFSKNSYKNIYRLFSKMLVIVRYEDDDNDEKISERYELIKKENMMSFLLEYDDKPIIKVSEVLINYCYLLSLLINTEDGYMGDTFLLETKSYNIPYPKDEDVFPGMFSDFIVSTMFEIKEKDEGFKWKVYSFIEKTILDYSKMLDDKFCDNKIFFKLQLIAQMLKVSGEGVDDNSLKVILLVSIIEMLLTHNPDNSRFNVEDSINKQFQLKTSIAIYFVDKDKNIQQIKDRLKIFYALRSSIAHGDFGAIDKTMKKVYELYKDKIDNIDSKNDYLVYYEYVISDLYDIVKKIVLLYLQDSEFIDFLKNT